MIPGSNILEQASELIAFQDVVYYQFNSRVLNSARQYVSGFNPPFTLAASVQRVTRSKYIQFDLEFQRNYVQVYASEDMLDLERDSAGDQFTYAGKLYQLESQGTWFAQDGWASCLAIEVGPASKAPTNIIQPPDQP